MLRECSACNENELKWTDKFRGTKLGYGNETFTPQHKCKAKLFLLIIEDLSEPSLEMLKPPHSFDPESLTTGNETTTESQISIYTLFKCTATSIIHINGHISNNLVIFLINDGSIHNFIQDRISKCLEYPSAPTNILKRMVGNGNNLDCNKLYVGVPLSLQSENFVVDFYVLPLCGADVVLGAPWLQSLEPLLMDYAQLSLTFTRQNKNKTLTIEKKGPTGPSIDPASKAPNPNPFHNKNIIEPNHKP